MKRWAILLGLLPVLAWAHTRSTGLATLDLRAERPAYTLTLAPAEIGTPADDLVAGAAGDAAAAQRVSAWLTPLLQLSRGGEPCRIARLRLQDDGGRIVLRTDFACGGSGDWVLDDRLVQRFGEHHRTIVSITQPDGTRREHILDQTTTRAVVGGAAAGWAHFIGLGAAHIAEGADHLLFLLLLALGSRGLMPLLGVVTAFTLAHSLSLAAAVLGWVQPSPALVEPLVALSIVLAAVENLIAVATWRWRVALAFGFGLVHGLAFAEALRELQLQGAALVRALVGFNLGVELAQAAVVLLAWPLLAWLWRQPPRWRHWLSAGGGAAGGVWLVQRLLA